MITSREIRLKSRLVGMPSAENFELVTVSVPRPAPGLRTAGAHGSIAVDVDHSLGKSLRGFLRQIVPDAALEEPVRILA